jgi:hypothetical protein
MRSIVKAVIFIALIIGFTRTTQAAFFVASPSSSTTSVGETITATVYVNSSNQAINVVSGSLIFDHTYLRVKGVSIGGSVVKFWIQEPSVPKSSANTIEFEGVVLNPGYTGSSGRVMTVTFSVLTEGSTSLSFSSEAILANDGLGTDVTAASSSTNILISKAVVEEKPTESKPETKPETNLEINPEVSPEIGLPGTSETSNGENTSSAGSMFKITEVPISVKQGESFSLGGVSPDGGVSVFAVKTGTVGVLDRTVLYENLTEGGYLQREQADVVNNHFAVEFSNLPAGRYAFYAKDEFGNVTSITFVEVVASFGQLARDFVLTWWWIALVLILVTALAYLFWRLAQVRALRHQKLLNESLSPKYDIYDRIIQKLDLGITLTAEEHSFLERIRGHYRQ